MKKQIKGLFLNTARAKCSIYESGKMSYDCLVLSDTYSLDYQEIDENSRTIAGNYEFYIFNYHPISMGWLDLDCIKKLPGFKAVIVLEVNINNPFCGCPDHIFDAYLVLDPTIQYFKENVYAFPRPLENKQNTSTSHRESPVPIIGSFGFYGDSKGFDKLIDAVNNEFDEAIIKINTLNPDWGGDSKRFYEFIDYLRKYPTKEKVKVVVTTNYFNKDELINWCAENTLNAFFYNRHSPGLSATTDQAIASGRPLAISTNPTFRHIHSYIKPYPYLSLKDAIEFTEPLVRKIQEDWKPLNFALKFEEVLLKNNIKALKINNSKKIKLPSVNSRYSFKDKVFAKQRLLDFIPPIVLKIRRKYICKTVTKLPPKELCATKKDLTLLEPFVHQVLHSYSQFQEDLLIDLLLNRKSVGLYVDVGANDPFFNNNTQRFYSRGWRGINIEPNFEAFKRVNENRAYDINLNIAISENTGDLPFYLIGNDSSLSSLDHPTAIKMAKMLNLEITSASVKVMPLSKVLDIYLNNRLIDFMSIDTEGHDLAVLKSNNWEKYRPSLVMVESKLECRDILLFMDKQKYLYIFSNHVNALFVDKMTNDKSILDIITWNQAQ